MTGCRVRPHFGAMRIGLIGTGRIGTFHATALSRHREVGSLIVTDADTGTGPRARGPAGRHGGARRGRDLHLGRGRRGHHRGDLRPRRTDRPGGARRAPGLLREAHRPRPAGHAGGARRGRAGRNRAPAGLPAPLRRGLHGRARGGALGTARAAAHRPGDDVRPVAAAGRLPAALRRALPGLPGPRLRHAALGHRAARSSRCTRPGRTPGPRCSARRATSTRPPPSSPWTTARSPRRRRPAATARATTYAWSSPASWTRSPSASTTVRRSPPPSRPGRRPPTSRGPGFLERFAPAYEAELAAFVDVVRGERANPCDGREALQALRIAEACELSRRERRPVRLAEIPGGRD